LLSSAERKGGGRTASSFSFRAERKITLHRSRGHKRRKEREKGRRRRQVFEFPRAARKRGKRGKPSATIGNFKKEEGRKREGEGVVFLALAFGTDGKGERGSLLLKKERNTTSGNTSLRRGKRWPNFGDERHNYQLMGRKKKGKGFTFEGKRRLLPSPYL